MHGQPLYFPVEDSSRSYAGLELLATAALLLTSKQQVTYANPAAENLFELSRRQLVGQAARAIFGDAPALFEAIAKAQMPPEAESQARKEVRRYERMPEAAAEAGMVRSYLDWLIELPWGLPPEKTIDIPEARRILDEDHYGLEKIKRRIVEYLAVRKLAPQGKAPILCFVGPPGVGKTSLGPSIARAMDRPFVRVSLGGVHDEAEIRATAGPISVPCPAISFKPSRRRARAIA